MVDDVDVIEFKPNEGSAEAALSDWFANNPNKTFQSIEAIYSKRQIVGVAILYNTA